ncbi:MAG: SET domain-containing protein [Akkermansiaceae bacterium]
MAKKKKKKQKNKVLTPEEEAQRVAKLTKRGQSDLVEVRGSEIHGRGVYATQDIEEGVQVIEYVGNLISKDESEKRAWAQFDDAKETGCAAVYIFNLTKKWDLDGNVEWNPARLINHSCDPNCEATQEKKRIYISSLRPLKKDEEITFDYGFDADSYADHPCLCGAENCLGYIVGKDHLDEFYRLLAEGEETPEED